MKETTMILKRLPPGFYRGLRESIFTLSPDKVYMVRQDILNEDPSKILTKYLFRLPTEHKTYEGLITKELYEGLLRDISFTKEEINCHTVWEYFFGLYTVRVYQDIQGEEISNCYAVGPEKEKEWQYEFQKYHI